MDLRGTVPVKPFAHPIRNRRSGMTIVELAVVILVMGILAAFLIPLIRSISLFQTSGDEATLLKKALQFSRDTATLSNQQVVLELDLDGDRYRVVRPDRSSEEVQEEVLLSRSSMSPTGQIVSVTMASGNRITGGILKIPYSPLGSSEEIYIHLGPEPRIQKTVHQFRYSGESRILSGEFEPELEGEPWSDNLEEW